jgi:hypothetical protein
MKKDIPSINPLLCLTVSLIIMLISSVSLMAGNMKKTIEIKPRMAGLVAYGTLMSKQDLEQTLGHKFEGQTYQVHLRGYIRGWALRRPFNDPQASTLDAARISASFLSDGKQIPFSGMVNLNVYPEKKGRMNAILYLLTEEDFLKVDKRERGYERRDVTDEIAEYDFSGGRVYVYEGLPNQPDTAATDPKEYILVKEYVDQVTRLCDAIGESFRTEFEKSTRPLAYRIVPFKDIIWKSPGK